MSDEEYTLRVDTIKKNRDKYFNYFSIMNDFIEIFKENKIKFTS